MRSFSHFGFRAALLVALMLVVFTGAAMAQTEPVVTDNQVNDIAKDLYCPVCENITLDTCGTAACADWRYEIRLQLESGMNAEQIKADFVRRFGDRVVGTPYDPVLRALSLVTPFVLIALGGYVFFRIARRSWSQPIGHRLDRLTPEGINTATDTTDLLRAQIERDIEK
jgi:cytochrome c-type biogenesis protein CcmH